MTAALVDRRDSDLLRALNDKHAHALSFYVVRLNGGDRVKAQDIVQETMLRAWRNRAVLEQTGGSQRGWLFAVARHIVIDEWRATRGHPELVTDQISEQQVEDTAQHTVDRQLVSAALRTLSTKHRQVLLECYYRGATVAEAAKTLGVPPGTSNPAPTSHSTRCDTHSTRSAASRDQNPYSNMTTPHTRSVRLLEDLPAQLGLRVDGELALRGDWVPSALASPLAVAESAIAAVAACLLAGAELAEMRRSRWTSGR
jgi:RNA polymerase sigma-70 factor, ECF subfamily